MILGLSSAGFYGRLETEDAAAHVRDFPAGACEVFLQTYSEYSRAFGETVRERLGNLPCVAVHPKGSQFELDLFGRSPRQAEDAMGIFTGVCDAGQALGARYYVFHGPGSVRGHQPPEKINALQERMAHMREIADRRGMEILWENVSWAALRRPEDVRTVREMLPDMGFVLDVKQAYQAGVEPLEMFRAMGGRLQHVHLLDWNTSGKLCLPGQGQMDWPGWLQTLAQTGYDGAVILEPYEHQTRDEAALCRSMEYLHRLIFHE